jgi:hypothetical protein
MTLNASRASSTLKRPPSATLPINGFNSAMPFPSNLICVLSS